MKFCLFMCLKSTILTVFEIGVGSTTWVLSQTDTIGGMILWNPMTGRSYRASDPTCPLHRVTCMADQSNIYYNTQSELFVFFSLINLPKIEAGFTKNAKLLLYIMLLFLFHILYRLTIYIHLLLHFPLGVLALGNFGVGESKAEPFVIPVVLNSV